MDHISELPNEVLSRMLSFLATKYAVRTSVLSERWKNLWASVSNLDFELKYGDNYDSECDGFFSFVDRVLDYHNSSDIIRFHLHCHFFAWDFARIEGWIRTAVQRNVVELDLDVDIIEGEQMFELPESVFLCKTLVVLKLASSCLLYAPPESGCFPNLKFLHVKVDYPDDESMEKLFSCCPLVENLTIEVLASLGTCCNFNISVPALKTLRIKTRYNSSYHHPHQCHYSIHTPNLEIIEVDLDIFPSFSFENSKSPVKAVVRFCDHHGFIQQHFFDHATTLLAAISNVEYLSLSAHSLDASCLPAFDNLTYLTLGLHDCYCWELLAELLKRSPNLECLVLEHKYDESCISSENEGTLENESLEDGEVSEKEANSEDKRNIEDEENSQKDGHLKDEEYSEHPLWNMEVSASICLLSHLKTVSLKGFKGRQDEKKVTKYLLKNGAVLEKMTISMSDFMYSKEDFCKEVAQFRRGSRICQVEFM